MENEKWIEMRDFPNYEISNLGRVRNAKNERVLKIVIDSEGYRMVDLYYNKKKYRKKVSRLVWMSFNEFCPVTIDHKNGNPSDDTLENLQCVSMKDNRAARTKYKKENKYNLTNEDRAYIHTSMTEGTETTWTIYKKYGLPLRYTRKVMQRGSWRKYVKSK